ncbi:MAG: hypothetical protein NUK63_07870 [Candidatus Bathyarchaeum tardum]|nr:MAG: hypothetical protein NUK63_07870 [Candidatus Bathyarchaeum tardum]
MLKGKASEHMSKSKTKGDNLPSLQLAIVLHLAKSEPQTINETVTSIEKSYKPAWIAFKSLEKKKLIWKTDVKEYRGRKYERYWLTAKGMIISILEGADRVVILEESKRLFPDVKILHCFLELLEHLNPMVLRLGLNVVEKKGDIDFVGLMTILISDTASESDAERMKRIVGVLKHYPEMYEQAKILIEHMIEQLKQLISD